MSTYPLLVFNIFRTSMVPYNFKWAKYYVGNDEAKHESVEKATKSIIIIIKI